MTIQHLQRGIMIATVLVWGRLAVGTVQHFTSTRSPESAPTTLVETDNTGECGTPLDRTSRASVSR